MSVARLARRVAGGPSAPSARWAAHREAARRMSSKTSTMATKATSDDAQLFDATRATNDDAQLFKALHVPGKPLILANVHDVTSARVIGALPACKALATASFSIALVNGTDDANLGLDAHLAAIRDISAVSRQLNKPLTVDLQDGYGDRLEEAVRAVIDLGVVGINLEDSDRTTSAILKEEDAVGRIKRALATAADAGVPDFVVNARSDTYLHGGSLQESIERGKKYLEAGATTIYVLGVSAAGFAPEEVKLMVEALDGRVNISLRLPTGSPTMHPLSSNELGELGVARISVGPQIYFAATQAIKDAANVVYGGGSNSST